MPKKSFIQLGLLVLLIGTLVLFFVFDGSQYLQLDYIKQQQNIIHKFYLQHQLLVLAIFFLIYTLFTALSLPAAAVLTLLSGALFGALLGTVVVSFASSVGATCAFLLARFVARDFIQQRYQTQLAKINEGFNKEGALYLFALRLVPAFPFFMVNVMTALVPMKARTFYWVSQLGMLPGTFVYVYTGTQLAEVESLSDIVSPQLLFAFALLGLFPLVAKKAIAYIRTRNQQIKI